MEKDLFIALKEQIKTELPEIKTIAIWNKQFNHLLKDKPDENPFQYPAVFIQFIKSAFRDLGGGVGQQEFDLDVITHLGFKSFVHDDLTILDLKQRLFETVHGFRQGEFARLSRIAEMPDYDYSNVQVYSTQYHTRGIDRGKSVRTNNVPYYLDLALSANTTTIISGGTI